MSRAVDQHCVRRVAYLFRQELAAQQQTRHTRLRPVTRSTPSSLLSQLRVGRCRCCDMLDYGSDKLENVPFFHGVSSTRPGG